MCNLWNPPTVAVNEEPSAVLIVILPVAESNVVPVTPATVTVPAESI